MNTFATDLTQNAKESRRLIGELSVTDLIKACDYINELAWIIDDEHEILDDLHKILNPIEEVIDKLKTNKHCPHCDSFLYKSDVDQYDYVCVDCDENFYECEVK